MLSLGSARAALLLYQNAKVASGAVDHLSRYIVPLIRDASYDTELVSLLESLGTRGDSLAPAVAFLMEWVSDKNSALNSIIFQARDILHRIELFLSSQSTRDLSSKKLSENEKDVIKKEVKRYLKDIEFLLASLNLAVSVANASEKQKPCLPISATIASTTTAPSSSTDPSSSTPSLHPWRQVFSSACIKLVRTSKSVYQLHITSLLPSDDGLTRSHASTLKYDLTASLNFRATTSRQLDLLEDHVARQRGSELVNAVFSFEDRIANTLQERFAFMLHSVDEVQPPPFSSSSSSADNSYSTPIGSPPTSSLSSPALPSTHDALRPLEIAYLARLCMYENMHAENYSTPSSAATVTAGMSRSSSRATITTTMQHDALTLRHTQASDEELWLLLAGVHIHGEPTSTTSTTTGSSAAPSSSTSTASSSSATSSSTTADPPRYISPSCLLRASQRLTSIGNMSGDLCVAYGSFYSQSSRQQGNFTSSIQKAVSEEAQQMIPQPSREKARWITPMSTVTDVQKQNENLNRNMMNMNEDDLSGVPSSTTVAAVSTHLQTNDDHFDASGLTGHVLRAREPSESEEYPPTLVAATMMTTGFDASPDQETEGEWNQISPTIHKSHPITVPANRSYSASTASSSSSARQTNAR